MKRAWHLGLLLTATTAAACGGEANPAGGSSMSDAGGSTGSDNSNGGQPGTSTGLPSCTPDSPVGEPCEDELGAVICPTDSDFPGDNLALCDQGQDKGIFLHYGPQDYDDPEDVAKFTLPAGGEDENCTYVQTSNETGRFVKSYRGRMRPNSHHMILRTDSTADFELTDDPQPCDFTQFVDGRWLVGSQDPQIDLAVGGGALGQGDTLPEEGDPDYRLGQKIPANTKIQYDMHYTNPTDETILRESWVWFDYAEESEVETLVDMITFFQGDINVPPQSTFTTERAHCVAPTDRYVGLITGHAHETLTRFSVWHHDAEGNEKLVYETYDWADPGNLFYRDGLNNPTPNEAAGAHGGSSGYLHVKEGESLSFECEYDNPTSETITLGETTNDEMCNVFGMYYPSDGDVWNCTCYGGCF